MPLRVHLKPSVVLGDGWCDEEMFRCNVGAGGA